MAKRVSPKEKARLKARKAAAQRLLREREAKIKKAPKWWTPVRKAVEKSDRISDNARALELAREADRQKKPRKKALIEGERLESIESRIRRDDKMAAAARALKAGKKRTGYKPKKKKKKK